MGRLIRLELWEEEGYHVILKNLKLNVFCSFFFVAVSQNLCSGFKVEKGEASTFSLRGLIEEQTTPTEMSGADLNSKCFATGCVIHTLTTEWLSGERQHLSINVLCIMYSISVLILNIWLKSVYYRPMV